MKKLKRVLCLALALTLSFCAIANTASARASYYLSAYLAYIYSEGDGKVSVWYEVEATDDMDEVGVLTIRLQEQAPGSSTWTSVKTYRYTDYPDMLSYDDDFHYGHVDYDGKVGYSYQAYVTVWAGKDGDGDSRIILAT